MNATGEFPPSLLNEGDIYLNGKSYKYLAYFHPLIGEFLIDYIGFVILSTALLLKFTVY